MWRCGKRSNQRTDELTERGKRGHDRHDFLRGGIKIRGQGGQGSERSEDHNRLLNDDSFLN